MAIISISDTVSWRKTSSAKKPGDVVRYEGRRYRIKCEGDASATRIDVADTGTMVTITPDGWNGGDRYVSRSSLT